MSAQRNFARRLGLGEAHPEMERVADLLEAAGYLNGAGRDDAQLLGPLVSAALRRYQAYRRLPITGVIDEVTLHDLNTAERYDPYPDIPSGAPVGALGIPEGFVLGPTMWTTRRLRYCFLNTSADLSAEQSRAVIRCALKLWSEVVPLYFVEVSPNPAADADIRIGFFTGDHGDGTPFDGEAPLGVLNFLAHGFYPPPYAGDYGGDLHFDDDETWTITFRGEDRAQPKDLLTTALHEIGHCLGLGHSGDLKSVMFNGYTGSKRTLAIDDIRGIRALYGSSSPVAPPPQAAGQALLRGDFRRLTNENGGVFANVFFRGGDGKLRQAFMSNEAKGFEQWTTIDHGLAIQGAPMAYFRGNREWLDHTEARITVYAVGADGHLLALHWDGSRWGTVDFGGNLQPGLAMTGRGDFGSPADTAVRVVVFGVGVDGHLVDNYWDGSRWTPHDHGGTFNPGLAVMGRGDHSQVDASLVRTNVFMTTKGDNRLFERYWDGSQWQWTDHLGSVVGTPAILCRGDLSQVDPAKVRASLFMAGTNGNLYERIWDGGKWRWEDHGGSVDGNPIVVGRGNLDTLDLKAVRINVFIRGSNGHLLARSWDGQSWSWADLGGAISAAPLQWLGQGNFCSVDNTQVRLRIFGQRGDGHLIEYHWDTAAWSAVDHGVYTSDTGITQQLLTPLLRGDRQTTQEDAVKLSVFAVASNGKLRQRAWNGSGWSWSEH